MPLRYRGRGVLSAVRPPNLVGSDPHDLLEHTPSVAERTDGAGLHVVPGDGNLDDVQTRLAGEVEQLHVESEAVDGLLGEETFRGLRREALEAALGIGKARTRCPLCVSFVPSGGA